MLNNLFVRLSLLDGDRIGQVVYRRATVWTAMVWFSLGVGDVSYLDEVQTGSGVRPPSPLSKGYQKLSPG
jgi:hypothetical protein